MRLLSLLRLSCALVGVHYAGHGRVLAQSDRFIKPPPAASGDVSSTVYRLGDTVQIEWSTSKASVNIVMWRSQQGTARPGILVGIIDKQGPGQTTYEWTVNLDQMKLGNNDYVPQSNDLFQFMLYQTGATSQSATARQFNISLNASELSRLSALTSTTLSSTTSTRSSTSSRSSSTSAVSTTLSSTSASETTSASTTRPTTTSTQTPQSDASEPNLANKSSGLSAGAGAGIGIGVTAAVFLIGLVIFLLWRRSKRASKQPAAGMPYPPPPHMMGASPQTPYYGAGPASGAPPPGHGGSFYAPKPPAVYAYQQQPHPGQGGYQQPHSQQQQPQPVQRFEVAG